MVDARGQGRLGGLERALLTVFALVLLLGAFARAWFRVFQIDGWSSMGLWDIDTMGPRGYLSQTWIGHSIGIDVVASATIACLASTTAALLSIATMFKFSLLRVARIALRCTLGAMALYVLVIYGYTFPSANADWALITSPLAALGAHWILGRGNRP